MNNDLHNNNASRWRDEVVVPAPEVQTGDPILVDLSTVKPIPVTWLWEKRVAIGKTTCIAGDPGLGKSFVTLDMAARVTRGAAWPDGAENPHGPGGVVLFSAEDDPADTIVPRLVAAGGDCERVRFCSGVATGKTAKVRAFTLADIDSLGRAVDLTPGCQLVVVDPVTAYMGDIDAHKNNEVRAMLAPIGALAADKRVAVVLVTHLNKGGGGKSVYRLSGSLAIPAAARTVWLVTKDGKDPECRYMLPVKNNIAPDLGGLAYTIEGDPAKVVWSKDPVTMTADEAMAAEQAGPEQSKMEAAAAWLRAQVVSGQVDSEEIIERGRLAGYSKRTIERAKPVAGVESVKNGYTGRWAFRLGDGAKTANPANRGGVAVYGDSGGVRYGDGPDTPEWARTP